MPGLFGRLFGKKEDDMPKRDVAALAAPLAVPAVHVVKTDAASRSHFGGSPDLPPGTPWPERDGRKLAFLARLSLAEVHAAHAIDWLPPSGALLFFYDIEEEPWGFDPKDRGGAVVLLVPDLPAPVPQPAGGGTDPASPIAHRNVAFRRVDVLPGPERDSVEALGLNRKEADTYYDLHRGVFGGEPAHQVAGYPDPVQGDLMELECQAVSSGLYMGDVIGYKKARAEAIQRGAANWRLLFQFETDDDLDVMWGDCGTLYYWVEEQAARKGDFANAWLILQCG